MKMFLQSLMMFALLPLPVAVAVEPDSPPKKLEGSDLTKYYLQQILDSTDDDPTATAESDRDELLGKLRKVVERLESEQQQKVAEQQIRGDDDGDAEQTAAASKEGGALRDQARLKPVFEHGGTNRSAGSPTVDDSAVVPASAQKPLLPPEPTSNSGDGKEQLERRVEQLRQQLLDARKMLDGLLEHLDRLSAVVLRTGGDS